VSLGHLIRSLKEVVYSTRWNIKK